jgi:type VII secretion integral membrane protein EccD
VSLLVSAPSTTRAVDAAACRLTVAGPGGRADLAVPAETTIVELLAALRRNQLAPPEGLAPWTLQRLGEEPLDPAGTIQSTGVRTGDVLYLRPAGAALSALAFDDVADGVATVVAHRMDRWRPDFTRRMSLVLAVLLLTAAVPALLAAGRGPVPAIVAGLLALAGTAASVVADRTARLIAGLAGMVFAALAGLIAVSRGGFGPDELLAAAAGAAVVSLALFAVRRLPAAIPAAALAVAAVVAATVGVDTLGAADSAGSAGAVAVAALVLGLWAPRLALRAGGLRVPALPHDARELQYDIEPVSERRLVRGVRIAQVCLTALGVATAVMVTVAGALLAIAPGWTGRGFAALLGAALLVRAWGQNLARQRCPSLLGGTITLTAAVVSSMIAIGGPSGAVGAAVLLAVAAAGLLAWSRRSVEDRLPPIWGRLAEIADLAIALALVPLAAQVLHLFAYVRGIF